MIGKKIKEMEKAIIEPILSDPILNLHHQNITRIKGLSTLSFAVIIAETNGFALFKNVVPLVSYAGYDVIEN